jgi:hypothetical protein
VGAAASRARARGGADAIGRSARWLALALGLLSGAAAADSWPAARPLVAFSEDGRRFVRVTPGESLGETVGFAGAPRGAHARAAFYALDADRSYRLVADVSLANPVAPIDLLLANDGRLVTFDNWHNAGYGAVVAIYDAKGEQVAAWELEQLYPAEKRRAISASVSSRWWRCRPFHFVDPATQAQVYVREALGGAFVFDLATGKFTYAEGSAGCEPAAQPLSATFR